MASELPVLIDRLQRVEKHRELAQAAYDSLLSAMQSGSVQHEMLAEYVHDHARAIDKLADIVIEVVKEGQGKA